MSFSHYLTDDTTLTTGSNFLAVPAGTDATAFAWHMWYGKGVTTATALTRLYLRPRIAGLYSGHALLDQRAFELRITGYDNAGSDPDFHPWTTSWTRVGTDAVLECPPMRSNTALYMEVRLSPAAQHTGTTVAVAYEIVPIYNEALPWEEDRHLVHGILTGAGDGETSEWIEAATCVESGTPDDKVNVGDRRWLDFGIPRAELGEAVTLDQTDVNSATLGVDEAYAVILSQAPGGGAVTVTKGAKDVFGDQILPAKPAGHLGIAEVYVLYDAGGGAIANAQIVATADNVDSQYKPKAGTGLELLVGKGRAVSSTGGISEALAQMSVVLPASLTRYAWLQPGASVALTAADAPPVLGATPLGTVTTDGSGVTALTDTRKFVGLDRLRLYAPGTLTTGTGKDEALAPYRGAIYAVSLRLHAASSGGATGATVPDVTVAGSSIYGTAPSITAGDLADAVGFADSLSFEEGDLISLDVTTITSGGTTEKGLEAILWICRR